ncbi:MAG: PAS domain S-box protein [Bryobacterales bacterium]|nr:PAS domain S-box protein [Bryobacterales bacterium]
MQEPSEYREPPEGLAGPGDALRFSEARFAGIVRLSEDAIISIDEDQRITLFSAGAERIFGYRAGEALGQPVDMLIPERYRQAHRQHVAGFKSAGDALRPMNERGEIHGIRKDGTEFPAQASISKFAVGKETILTVRLRDMTDMLQTAGALRKSEATTGALLESVAHGVVGVDQSGVIRVVNAKTEQMFGYTREELLGEPVETLLPERFRNAHVSHLRQYLEHPRSRPMGLGMDLGARRKDGSEFPAEISLSYIKVEDSTIVLSFISDITERKRIEEQIRRSLAEKDVLLREVHHRVKNNLQVISSLLSLRASMCKDPVSGQVLRDSRDRVNAMALIHERLFQADDLSAIDFSRYIDSLAQALLHSYGADRKGVRIQTGISVSPVADQAIPCGLIINELLSNALKHAYPDGRGGVIHVDMHSDGDWCSLRVSDDGIGLPEDGEIENSETLGLKLVGALAAQLGATLDRHSEGGTAFQVRFRLETAPSRR